ncbi:hypothetical protein IEO21_08798 [Rhodonia placenta]|uniref:Kinase n=1 Tax=Rhodonia placenta TaxID=104341 RepID=A0A8H7TZ16_9APHY|nr:hypothetical protein IEO21_08798 [Postia placenta]
MSASSSQTHLPLTTQVGGHPGVLTTEDGVLLIKRALPREVAFYQSVSSDPALAQLYNFIPEFYGTLKLEGRLEHGTSITDPNAIKPNLSYTFSKPNVLDVKLGTVLYDEDASPEKRARMEQVARETTSAETGLRLTGFQVYDLTSDKPVVAPKSYGKSIKAADLPEGIARFFPLAESPAQGGSSVSSSSADETTVPPTGTGLLMNILEPLLSGIREEVGDLTDAFSGVDMRMVGGSLLIVYEADWERAREGLRLLQEQAEEGYQSDNEDEEGEEEDEEDEEGEDSGELEGAHVTKPVGPPFVVRLIDFAHTRMAPGQGPDEGVLQGLRTVLRLLDGRLDQLRRAA